MAEVWKSTIWATRPVWAARPVWSSRVWDIQGGVTIHPTLYYLFLEANKGVTIDESMNASSWVSQDTDAIDHTQETLGKKPTYTVLGINSEPSLAFDGAADFLQGTGDTSLQQTDINIQAVVQFGVSAFTSDHVIAQIGDRIIGVDSSGNIYTEKDSSRQTGDTVVSPSDIVHIEIDVTSGTTTIFVDGDSESLTGTEDGSGQGDAAPLITLGASE